MNVQAQQSSMCDKANIINYFEMTNDFMQRQKGKSIIPWFCPGRGSLPQRTDKLKM